MNKVFLIIIVTILASTCKLDTCKDTRSDDSCPDQACRILPEIAEAIAKGYMCLDYELGNYQVDVIESGDTYEVHFKRVVNQNLGTGGPIVFIRKNNGNVIYAIHSK